MTEAIEPAPKRLRIWQQNINKSKKAHMDLINSNVHKEWDVLLLQEPYIDIFGNSKGNPMWTVLYPADKGTSNKVVRSVIMVKGAMKSDTYEEIKVPGSNDITAIQISGAYGRLAIFNIYNDGKHSDTLRLLDRYIGQNKGKICTKIDDYMIWAGDFNRHHPLWDEERNAHLFTRKALDDAQVLIEMVAEHNMIMALPKDLPTLEAMNTKNWTRPDNVWASENLEERLVTCTTEPRLRGPGTDHVPILTVLELPVEMTVPKPSRNFRMTDWHAFREELAIKLEDLPEPTELRTKAEFQDAVEALTRALQEAIAEKVPMSKPCPHSRRWWNKDLDDLRRKKSQISNESYKLRAMRDHPVHAEHSAIRTKYGDAIENAKRQHWIDFLEEASEKEMWTANKYISNPVGDGGKTRIPSISYIGSNGRPRVATSNEEKSKVLGEAFFPAKPGRDTVPEGVDYPEPIEFKCDIKQEQVRRNVAKLRAYGAPGTDEIPNVVLKESIDLIIDYLVHIYRAIFKLETYVKQWQEWITVVLRKPGKPNYNVPKAYRPVALLNTLGKLLTAIVTEDITYMCEKFELLPATHFGGRPGRTTTDALHLMTDRIKHAWRNHRVVSVLFLDIEGAFPNAVTARLLHNMRSRRVPEAYVTLVERMLRNRRTKLRFDDYLSDYKDINNGIGQGDPLSMIIYLFYNADLLEIPVGKEGAVAFVDDASLIAEADSFEETHQILHNMMTRTTGGLRWSTDHNSKFEASKLRIVDFSPKRVKHPQKAGKTVPMPRPEFRLEGKVIKREEAFKSLGVLLDQELNWKAQTHAAIAKATKWILLFKRLTKPSTGLKPKLMRQMYQSVAIPKLTYAADVWYRPPHKMEGHQKNSGSVRATREMGKIQRVAALAITGALRSTANDVIDIHANLTPIDLQMSKVCHRAITRLAALPEAHPLYKPVRRGARQLVRRYPSQLHYLAHIYQIKPDELETLCPVRRAPNRNRAFTTSIAGSREESKQLTKDDDADIRIFTDGSGLEGQAGAAAVLYRRGNPPRRLRYHLGPISQHTTFDAEAVGALLGAHLLSKERRVTTVTLSIDCQAVIKSTEIIRAQTGQDIMDEFQRSLRSVQKQANRRTYKMEMRWISGHDEVEENEDVDKQAKMAAGGDSSPVSQLPRFLTEKKLPGSVAACKQTFAETIKRKWEARWKESPRYAKMAKIDPKLPSPAFSKATAALSRAQSSVLIQLRTGHIGLNHHMKRIKKTQNDSCPNCAGIAETIHHYLFDCPEYDHERHELGRRLGRDAKSLKFLLNAPKGIPEILRYVGKTGRLRKQFGEVTPVILSSNE